MLAIGFVGAGFGDEYFRKEHFFAEILCLELLKLECAQPFDNGLLVQVVALTAPWPGRTDLFLSCLDKNPRCYSQERHSGNERRRDTTAMRDNRRHILWLLSDVAGIDFFDRVIEDLSEVVTTRLTAKKILFGQVQYNTRGAEGRIIVVIQYLSNTDLEKLYSMKSLTNSIVK